MTCCFTVQCVANALCMDDLDRLVSVDAAETHAASSASGGGAAAVAGPQADPGSKNGQYRLFAMVSHLGKNTTSGACPPSPPESSQRAELLLHPPPPSLTRHRPLRCAHHERRPVAALQRREGAASSRPPSPHPPHHLSALHRLPIQSSRPPSSRTCLHALLSLAVMCDVVTPCTATRTSIAAWSEWDESG
jgi:hypothetical protein